MVIHIQKERLMNKKTQPSGYRSDGTLYVSPVPEQTRYLIAALTVLRRVIGEERVTALARSDVETRQKLWKELLMEDDPATRDAVACVLTGLGLDLDELVEEAAE